ncbi:MAG: NAD(P)-dependent oxidoreductase [Alphaproteobacteria bacterium]
MSAVLVTGGAGFFGGVLKDRLLREGQQVVSVDLEPDGTSHPSLIALRGDITDRGMMESLFAKHRFETVYHCAAILAHVARDKDFLWRSNVEGTRVVADSARKHGTKNLVFTSSNCLWGHNLGKPVEESDPPAPVEIYGRSKWEGEKILESYRGSMNVAILRCPTILDEGRLGLLTILFDFILEGRKVWVVGGGRNRYQFIYAKDLADACLLCASAGASDLFHVGSDDVKSFREVYQHVIERAGTGARVASLPRAPTLLAMRAAYHLGLSPLGPYQYKMIAEDFVFATGKIKAALGWQPTLTNEDMLWLAYRYYAANRGEINRRTGVSAHRRSAKMGIIRLLKWLS